MTNTKFRKRALLSSVAMLLVALIALGSATFAWFAANPNTSTQGLQLRTTASTGLVMKTETDSTWDHETFFGVKTWANNATGHTVGEGSTGATFENFNLKPASQNQTTPNTFYTVDAVDAGHYNAYQPTSAPGADDAVDNTVSTISSLPTALYSEKFSFRLSDGSADQTNATIKLTGVTITPYQNASSVMSTMYGCVRVAVVDASGSLVATYAASQPTNKALAGTGDYSGVSKTAITNAAAASTNITTNNVVFSGALTAAENQTGKECTVYVYLDGEDSNCFSNNVGTINAEGLISNIQLNFTLE